MKILEIMIIPGSFSSFYQSRSNGPILLFTGNDYL